MSHLHISLKQSFDTFIREYKIEVKNVQNSQMTTAYNALFYNALQHVKNSGSHTEISL
jgi:hypothetical protein